VPDNTAAAEAAGTSQTEEPRAAHPSTPEPLPAPASPMPAAAPFEVATMEEDVNLAVIDDFLAEENRAAASLENFADFDMPSELQDFLEEEFFGNLERVFNFHQQFDQN
jgi:hypothetical protein